MLGTTHWNNRPYTSHSNKGWRNPMMSLWRKKKTIRRRQTMISDNVLNFDKVIKRPPPLSHKSYLYKYDL